MANGRESCPRHFRLLANNYAWWFREGLIPTTKGDWARVQERPALRAFVRLFPQSYLVAGGNGTGQLPSNPLAHIAGWQAVQQNGESGRRFGMKIPVHRGFESNYGIIKFLALGAEDGLNDDMPAAIGAARDASTITTSGTLEEIRATHRLFSELQTVCSRTAGFGAAVFALRVAPSEDWWVGRDSNPGPMP